MSVNGVAEAFVTATASPSELNRLSRAMVMFAVIYLLLAAVGLHLAGSVGLVLANCLNMAVRIAYAFAFVKRASGASLRSDKTGGAAEANGLRMMLSSRVLLALAAAAALTNAAKLWLGTPLSPPVHHLAHVALGGACLVGVGIVAWKSEPELLVALRAARRERRAD